MFDRFYYRAFPTLKKVEFITNLKEQKEGLDKRLYFSNGKVITIDEKKRRKDWADILIEEYSDFDKKKVGWIGKHKKCDYIVYAFMKSKKVYLLPFLLLQKVWLNNYGFLLKSYGRIFADNKTYKTSSIPVPINVLLDLLKNEMSEVF